METQDLEMGRIKKLEQESEFVKKIRSLEKEIELGRRDTQFEEVYYSVGELMEKYMGTCFSNEKLILNIEKDVHLIKTIIDKKSATIMIEKLLIGIPIMPIFVTISNNIIEVRNGGYDLAIIFSFFGYIGEKWSLDGLYLPSSKGMFVDDLPLRMQSKIKNASIEVHVSRIE